MNNKARKSALDTTRAENFADWYQAVITGADMAEPSGVRGCMIIKPWGFAIWERIKGHLDREIRATGHENCYFPIFIPIDLIQKEATHVEGFAKEMAIVTHHRLESRDGKLIPAAPLEIPLVIRPTSETVIGEAFARWIKSYRDLPVKINQWANVVRWELRPRMFLRTTEFLWQEGHTAHATAEEAVEHTKTMLGVYRHVVENCMAIPVIAGTKSLGERFPGAVETHTIEAMMQDGRALQSGTSHYLGQNFSKAANITFQDRNGESQLAYTTSWGVSTRLIGALIMVHSDDDGLRLPPKIAPYHVVVIPIIRNDTQGDAVIQACQSLAHQLGGQSFADEPVRVFVDLRDESAAVKRWKWIKKGIPFICEIGPRDNEKSEVSVHKRLEVGAKPTVYGVGSFVSGITNELAMVQQQLTDSALATQASMTRNDIKNAAELEAFFNSGNGFVRGKLREGPEADEVLRGLGVTIRCIPYDQAGDEGRCIITGEPAVLDVVLARAY
ncbi:proline--tRNA ligase [Bradyrhizobium betae]|uniref:proline--tRNA ligase n=1 Tax=Bradyrhizobium betae TaxID=244734 RepID=UPI003D667EAC